LIAKLRNTYLKKASLNKKEVKEKSESKTFLFFNPLFNNILNSHHVIIKNNI